MDLHDNDEHFTPAAPAVHQGCSKVLQVSTKTIRRWIDYADLRVHRLGRQLRISEEDLAAVVNKRRS